MIRNKYFTVAILLSSLFAISCSNYRIYNLNDAPCIEIEDHGLIYALPKTVLRVEVETRKVEYKAGSYASYAEKYLGIQNVPKKDSIAWYISDVQISSYAVPDSGHYYYIESDHPTQSDFLQLSQQGLIVSINSPVDEQVDETNTDLFLNKVFNKSIKHTQLPVMDAQTERIDTTFRTIVTDSSFLRIPVLHKQQVNKTMEEKASEIADLILELREEKVALITGDINKFPDGDALGIIISEFKKIEDQYLPLFTGTQSEQVVRSVYDFTPSLQNQKSNNVLFRFSPHKGILSNTDLSGVPVMVVASDQRYTKNVESFIQHKDTIVEKAKGLFYRIPEEAVVQIVEDSKVIASKRIQLAQYGKNNILPFRFIKNKNLKIEFYPGTGALKGVSSLQ
ncbi:MAG: DUF4831 family protein [Bacteroidales bacterium]|nr:DUF4831 family protein [Bacteroidales bacterium]MCF8455941.1 DUF4831 family protein [Bacteroidales bacterium]